MSTNKKVNDPILFKKTIKGESFVTRAKSIDDQYKHLAALTHQLDKACDFGEDSSYKTFKESMKRVVGYVRSHFVIEQEQYERADNPDKIYGKYGRSKEKNAC